MLDSWILIENKYLLISVTYQWRQKYNKKLSSRRNNTFTYHKIQIQQCLSFVGKLPNNSILKVFT